MERIAYPGEAALWELDWPDREPAVGRIVPPAANGANGLRPQFLVSCQSVQGWKVRVIVGLVFLPVEQEPHGGPTDFEEFRQSAGIVILALRVVL